MMAATTGTLVGEEMMEGWEGGLARTERTTMTMDYI